MPSETRQIIFTNEEVVAAIQLLYQRSHQSFPKGRIWDIAVSEDNGCQVDCDVIDTNNVRERVTVAGAKLAAALILFCITRKVPLPAASKKALSVVNNHLALCVTLGEAVES
jgi:hypothetical protein